MIKIYAYRPVDSFVTNQLNFWLRAEMFYLLLRQIILISLCATYFAVPLVAGRLYKSANKPCVITDHFNPSYSQLY